MIPQILEAGFATDLQLNKICVVVSGSLLPNWQSPQFAAEAGPMSTLGLE